MRAAIDKPERAAVWQAAYNAGQSCAAIAAQAGVDRTTVQRAITVRAGTGPKPTLDPIHATAMLQRRGTVSATADALGVGANVVRRALWRAGLLNDPLGKGRPDMDWPTGQTLASTGDVERRIAARDARVRVEPGDPGEVAERLGMDVEVVRSILRRPRAR